MKNMVDIADDSRRKATSVVTNADHIRSMTDEELAKWLEQWCNNGEMCYSCPLDACPSDTKLSFLDWLKQPYKEVSK